MIRMRRLLAGEQGMVGDQLAAVKREQTIALALQLDTLADKPRRRRKEATPLAEKRNPRSSVSDSAVDATPRLPRLRRMVATCRCKSVSCLRKAALALRNCATTLDMEAFAARTSLRASRRISCFRTTAMFGMTMRLPRILY